MAERETSEEKLDPAAYNRLVAHARIQAIRLIHNRYDMKPAALRGDRQDWSYNVSNKLLDWHCNNNELLLSGTWEYTASCYDKRRQMLKLVAKFLVTYRLSDVCDPNAAQAFFERVGKFAAYPYFRATFAAITQQSGITLHPLPIISDQPRWVTPPADLGGSKQGSKKKKKN